MPPIIQEKNELAKHQIISTDPAERVVHCIHGNRLCRAFLRAKSHRMQRSSSFSMALPILSISSSFMDSGVDTIKIVNSLSQLPSPRSRFILLTGISLRQLHGQTSTHPLHLMQRFPSKTGLTWHCRQRFDWRCASSSV